MQTCHRFGSCGFTQSDLLLGNLLNSIKMWDDIRKKKLSIIFYKNVIFSKVEYFSLHNLRVPICDMLKIFSKALAYGFDKFEKLIFVKSCSSRDSCFNFMFKCSLIRMLENDEIDFVSWTWDNIQPFSLLSKGDNFWQHCCFAFVILLFESILKICLIKYGVCFNIF